MITLEDLSRFKNGVFDPFMEYKISFEQVTLVERENILKLHLSSLPMSAEESSALTFQLKEAFPFFNVQVFFDIQPVNTLTLEEQITKSIGTYCPSYPAWMEELDISVHQSTIMIQTSSNLAYCSLTSNGFKEQLIKDCLSHGDFDVKIEMSEVEELCEDVYEDFCDRITQEENSIAQKASEAIAQQQAEKPKSAPTESKGGYLYGKDKFSEIVTLKEAPKGGFITVHVNIFDREVIDLKDGKALVILSCTDQTDSRHVKFFVNKKDRDEFLDEVTKGKDFLIYGKFDYDDFEKDFAIMGRNLKPLAREKRQDQSSEKRVELHLHSNMSNMDGVNSISDFVARAAAWGHEAISITDHNDVQAFPAAMSAGKKHKIKINYGVEADLVDDEKTIVNQLDLLKDETSFTVFDLETTGFSPVHDQIIEIGAVKIENGHITKRFGKFVNPQIPIPEKIVELTGIDDEMVKNAPLIDKVMAEFIDFIGDSVLVAHNAGFDSRFLATNIEGTKGRCPYTTIDTLLMAQCLVEDVKNYRLGTLAKRFGISLQNAHRAVHDAEATAELFLVLMDLANKVGIENLHQLNELRHPAPEKTFPSHLTILAKNQKGLFNLYKLISETHMETFYRTARLKKSSLKSRREGLLLGSTCYEGELVQAILKGVDDDSLRNIASEYDFLEIQPVASYLPLMGEHHVRDQEDIQELIKKIIEIGRQLDIPVVATGDVHYLDPEDQIYHDILKNASHRYNPLSDTRSYFYTTDEMLREFSFLGDELAYEVVVTNSRKINDEIEPLDAIPSGKFPPKIKHADEDLREMVMTRTKEIYGDPLPELVEKRVERELDSIIENGYSVMYIISQKLVKQSNDDGFYVGSRGSVGSSFVATMSGITEVNPLVPHYLCPNCKYSEFIEDGSYSSGIDLPKKDCPHCHTPLNREGHTIPFEVFLGFYGDKEPDIDLNFAGEYQPVAHKYIEDQFGSDFVFRAGTIGTLAERTAYGLVKKYCEERQVFMNPVEIDRMVAGCVGVKRTSGQHPGGIMIVPKDLDIHHFTPIQYPADRKESNVITTHFDYHAISENILKLDILGHDAPSILKMLEDFTGVNMNEADLNDEAVMSLFRSSDALKMDPDIFEIPTGTLGIPEFGTDFVIKMLLETMPQHFSELVNISGLSHGTDVWSGNAQTLVNQNKATLSEVISTREDIMNYLIQAGAPNKMAFDVMEKVRKGKGIPPEYEEEMRNLTLPSWYIDSCQKIKYMFPKAHAVAYVLTSVRIAWYKIYYPEAFYASLFTTKLLDFNGDLMMQGPGAVFRQLQQLENQEERLSTKEKAERNVLQLGMEMFARGLKFKGVDLYKSHATDFKIDHGDILLPLQSLSGVGEGIAKQITKEAQKGEFLSIEDLVKRTGASKTVVEALRSHQCLDSIPESNQLNLLDFI